MYVRGSIIVALALLTSANAFGAALSSAWNDYQVAKKAFDNDPANPANQSRINDALNAVRSAIAPLQANKRQYNTQMDKVNKEQSWISNRIPAATRAPAAGAGAGAGVAGLPAPAGQQAGGRAGAGVPAGLPAPAAGAGQQQAPQPQPAPQPQVPQLNPNDAATPYTILGLALGASDDQVLGIAPADLNNRAAVRRAYLRLAAIWHPDNRNNDPIAVARYAQPDVRSLTDAEKEQIANEVMKIIGEAYSRHR